MSIIVQTTATCDEHNCTNVQIVSGRGMAAKKALYRLGWTSHLQTWRCRCCAKKAAKVDKKAWHARYRVKQYRKKPKKQTT